MATCPTCKTPGLKHILLSADLPAYACPDCSGLLVSLVAYRRWRELHDEDSSVDAADGIESIDDSDAAINCTRCGGIMTKYRFSAESPNHIDFCAHCEDIWLDHGEWQLVEALAGSDHLANILTQPWQRRILSESQQQMERDRLQGLLGDDYAKVMELRDWLHDHAHRNVVYALLMRRED